MLIVGNTVANRKRRIIRGDFLLIAKHYAAFKRQTSNIVIADGRNVIRDIATNQGRFKQRRTTSQTTFAVPRLDADITVIWKSLQDKEVPRRREKG